MDEPYHAGELEIQRRAEVLDEARAVGRIIGSRVPAGAARYLAGQRLAIASSLEPGGRVWASLLAGPAGFVSAVDPELLSIAARPAGSDPLARNLAARPELGLLLLDPWTRQRMRFNGRGLLSPDGIFLLVEQAYGNCFKYIQRRRLRSQDGLLQADEPRVGTRLTPRQQDWIASADTFFIASFHPQSGADASHRGGSPGFVRILDPSRLAFADYPGNNMFNTLGNLAVYPEAGLLFVDFAGGDLLQLTGRARVEPDFSVVFQVDEVRETPGGSPLRSGIPSNERTDRGGRELLLTPELAATVKVAIRSR
jgi:predicted pyridoxine 5'-phosphate oxidase superfamily flavin-nucleotide-binding protein